MANDRILVFLAQMIDLYVGKRMIYGLARFDKIFKVNCPQMLQHTPIIDKMKTDHFIYQLINFFMARK